MPVATTSVRLIEFTDAPAIADHLARDVEAFSRWDPARPADFYTTEGQVERIDLLLSQHLSGLTWPGGIAHSRIYVADAWRDEVFWEQTLATEAPTL